MTIQSMPSRPNYAWLAASASFAALTLVACSESAKQSELPRDRAESKTETVARPVAEPQPTGAITYEMAGSETGFAAAPPPPENTERYPDATPNPIKVAAEEPVSTFSIDVDTASYGVLRRYLNDGVLPPSDAVRIEELVNYFDYDYALPETREAPFKPTVAVYDTPWHKGTQLLHIGIKGFDLPQAERPKANLVFLIDVSGSMQDENKLPLVRKAFRLLVDKLEDGDTVSMVVYAGAAGVVLEPTSDKWQILAALERLEAGGSTAGGEGIRQAYALAEQAFVKDGVNRVILASDGDFNVGITDPDALEDFVARKRETGIALTVLGFGGGNYNDVIMQKLAQAGNGNAAYIDTLNEAQKVLVEEMGSTLFTIANDVKIQVEFNPAVVAEYRLIGYETRLLERTDFNNDKVDAGDIGAGHAVTALYEITPVGSPAQMADPLRYGQPKPDAASGSGTEIAFLRLRYKLPGETASRLIERPVTKADQVAAIDQLPDDLRFASAVAGFGEIVKGGAHSGQYGLDDVIALAQGAKGEDPFGYRAEFVQLARLAKSAQGLPTAARGDGAGQ